MTETKATIKFLNEPHPTYVIVLDITSSYVAHRVNTDRYPAWQGIDTPIYYTPWHQIEWVALEKWVKIDNGTV